MVMYHTVYTRNTEYVKLKERDERGRIRTRLYPAAIGQTLYNEDLRHGKDEVKPYIRPARLKYLRKLTRYRDQVLAHVTL